MALSRAAEGTGNNCQEHQHIILSESRRHKEQALSCVHHAVSPVISSLNQTFLSSKVPVGTLVEQAQDVIQHKVGEVGIWAPKVGQAGGGLEQLVEQPHKCQGL